MKRRYAVVGVVLAAITVFAMRHTEPLVSQVRAREVSPLQLQQQFPVPGVAGRIDHFTGDAKRHLLIFSALGNNTVEITSTFKSTVVHSLKGFERTSIASLRSGVRQVNPKFDVDGRTARLAALTVLNFMRGVAERGRRVDQIRFLGVIEH